MKPPGESLLELAGQATRELVLVSPFIKVAALLRILEATPPQCAVTCVTRWRPDEIVAGVSDLEVWDVISQRDGASLWLRPDLHAKYYRADDRMLVGSANLTLTGLGWVPHSNLELLIEAEPGQLDGFEHALMRGSVQVDEDLYTLTRSAVEKYRDAIGTIKIPTPEPGSSVADDAQALHVSREAWLPSLRYPENLYLVYAGKGDTLTSTSREMALNDLALFDVPGGLEQEEFNSFIGLQLLQMPIVRRVDAFVTIPQRFGAVADLLRGLPCALTDDFEAKTAWQVLMRWLLHFLPHRYVKQQPHVSEVFSRSDADHSQ